MRQRRCVVLLAVLLCGWRAGGSQVRGGGEAATRYFELQLVLRYPGVDGREPRVESLTTDVAVRKDRPGASSCKARVISQVPVTMQKGPTYLDLGTKLDCNGMRVEGGALAMSVVLEVSWVRGTVRTEDKEGHSVEEPLISQRNLQLEVRLPLGKPTVVFDAKGMEQGQLRALPGAAKVVAEPGKADEMEVEMTARELP